MFPVVVVSLLALTASFIILQTTWAQQIPSRSNASEIRPSVDPLSTWNNGAVKQRIIDFVQNVTDPSNVKYYIPPEDRIAVFDNDGTLWPEKPIPFQGYFAFDRITDLIAKNPELEKASPFKEYLEKKLTSSENPTEKDVMNLMLMTHSNISQPEFDKMVQKWSESAMHPQTHKKFVDMVYQPMIELINFLKDNQFKVFVVSGGDVDFMRDALSQVYGIPSEQIIGSSIKYKYIDSNTGNSTIFREPELNSFDVKAEKPASIQLHIGKVPVFAAGNSDVDLQMLKYVDDNNKHGKSLEILVHHDDGAREYSYNKGTENALQEAKNRSWVIISMANDFRQIYSLAESPKIVK